MLTPKQEKFIQNLIRGMSQREAYKNSYNASNMKDETIDNNAYKLMQNSEILTRYKELRDKADNEAIMSAVERKKWLTDIITGAKKEKQLKWGEEQLVEADMNNKLKAMDILNKMDGEYVTKVQGSVNIDSNPFKDLTTEELRQLIKDE